jgi:hypothetical protein
VPGIIAEQELFSVYLLGEQFIAFLEGREVPDLPRT